MKNFKPLLTLLAITVSTLQFTTPTSAIVSSDGAEVWTAENLLLLGQDMALEREECVDSECQRLTYQQQISRGGIYQAYRAFREEMFNITSIDNINNKIKIVIHDRDINRWLETGKDNRESIRAVHVVWLDPDFNPDVEDYIEPARTGTDPRVHLVYGSSHVPEAADYPLTDAEFEIDTSSSGLSFSGSTKIYYALVDEIRDWKYQGSIDFSACSAYPEAECKLVYNALGESFYMPMLSSGTATDNEPISSETEPIVSGNETISPATEPVSPGYETTSDPILSPTNTNEDSEIVPPSQDDEIASNDSSDEITKTPGNTTQQSDSIKNNNQIKANLNPSSSKETVKTPETGEPTEGEGGSIEFPWWLGVIFASGIVALIWLFWPNRKNSSKKS